MHELIFSPTGGTEKAAEVVAKALGSELETVDLSDANFKGRTVERGALAEIAMPSFGGRAPQTAMERLKKVQGSGARGGTGPYFRKVYKNAHRKHKGINRILIRY